jgi:hypothetical protein
MELQKELQDISQDINTRKNDEPVDWLAIRDLARRLDRLATHGIREGIRQRGQMVEK